MRGLLPWIGLASLASVFVAVGCTVDDPNASPTDDQEVDDSVGEVTQPIKGGANDSNDHAVVGVAALIGQSGLALCSGSLLLPNMVLTARHCVSDISGDGGSVDCGHTTASAPFAASSFYVTTHAQMSQNPSDYHSVREVITVPSENQLLCGNDQAILILNDNVPDSEATPYIPRVDSALDKNEQYYAIGFGATDDNGTGTGQRRRRDNLFVDCAEDNCPVSLSSVVKQSEWVGDTGICEGDSGGPALDMSNRVVGVTSRGGQGCTSPVYGSVHSWGQWIIDSGAHAAELGGYDPPSWVTGNTTDPTFNYPVGGPCDDACESGLCSSNICTRECNDDAPCPDGFSCKTVGGLDVCTSNQKKAKRPTQTTTTTCSVSTGSDPTNPVPWVVGAGAAIAIIAGRRSRRRLG